MAVDELLARDGLGERVAEECDSVQLTGARRQRPLKARSLHVPEISLDGSDARVER